MNWISPKVDWTENDYINVTDYNRIKNNLLYLKDLCGEIFLLPGFDEMATKDVTQFPYADELNAIENNIESLNLNSYVHYIGNKKTFVENGFMPDYNELQRIEKAMLDIYNRAIYDVEILTTLSFSLGNMRGIKT